MKKIMENKMTTMLSKLASQSTASIVIDSISASGDTWYSPPLEVLKL
jgi:hypothetical protein